MSELRPIRARYAHVNIVAEDWRALAAFYVRVFGCEPVGVERDHHGPWVETLTGIPGARIFGQHLRVPGYSDGPGKGAAPTIEIFQYAENSPRPATRLNTPGFPHIAFEVDDVVAARALVLACGGSDIGAMHTREVPGEGTIELVYMADPEGNVVELQKWTRAER
jgi:catechol 2,3-dioxygenase-like lactoylglutathione lyase family enzyme